ncbi:cysteine desulfurase family protein [Ekhidna sp.]|uniref:cysteine desulfurase family protein n=1 Tax=Ekhidna sp. TaxID=2608089 RepID=UPI003B501ACD
MIQRAYLDNNATTPTDLRVVDEMLPYFSEQFGNASSRNHAYGWEAKEAVDHAREQVSDLIGANPSEIIFTSGATESNNLALKGLLNEGDHFITCATEHKAILDPAESLAAKGIDVEILPAQSDGSLEINAFKNVISDHTRLVSIMMANNETGCIQPIKELSTITHSNQTLFHTDATQAVGKVPVDVNELGIDLMSFSSHKMYGPKGIGALYIRKGSKVKPLIEGGGHERGVRSGTLNVPAIVGFGKACELCKQEMREEGSRIKILRDKLEQSLLSIDDAQLNGGIESRLPNVTNIAFSGVDGERLLLSLNGLAVSQGSACTSAVVEPSHVLKAMGIPDQLANSSLRFSLGRFTTKEEIDFAIQKVTAAVHKLRT